MRRAVVRPEGERPSLAAGRRARGSLCLAAALGLALGCANATFKRGATPGDMARDEQACRGETTSEDAYRACLRDRGWFVGTLEDVTTSGAEPR